MKVQGFREFLSIRPFDEIELPALTLLVGPNGSGKSHFLQAIEQGAIGTDFFGPLCAETNRGPNPAPPGILRLENAGEHPAELSRQVGSNLVGPSPKPELARPFSELRAELLQPVADELKRTLREAWAALELNGADVWRLTPESICEMAGAADRLAQVRAAFDEATRRLTSEPGGEVISEFQTFTMKVAAVANRLSISPLSVTASHVADLDGWGVYNAFNPNVAQVFGAYRDTHLRNDLQRVKDMRSGTALALTDEQFQATYGPPPWELVSKTLEEFGLNYRVSSPPGEPTDPIHFVLERLDTGAKVPFQALSSGERVLLRFAISLLAFDPLRVKVTAPRLLLLDEMDASLHPEMVHRWLAAIAEGLVGKMGMMCILTTHSPTTVALAPESSLFEITAGSPRPKKVTKQGALNRLTFGVPALSIDYSGRRQVFVESDTDAACYEKLVSAMKGRLSLDRSLTFISTGIRKGRAETNAGCAIVRKLVSELSASGNRSVFGVVDWDGQNTGDDRLIVLAEGTHYSLDNVLLDPLLLAALILRDFPSMLQVSATFASLDRLTRVQLQALVDAVQAPISYPDDPGQNRIAAEYQEVPTLDLLETHCKMNGHELEAAVARAFPALQRYTAAGRGKLTAAVIERVLLDYPGFCPLPLARLFQELSCRPIPS